MEFGESVIARIMQFSLPSVRQIRITVCHSALESLLYYTIENNGPVPAVRLLALILREFCGAAPARLPRKPRLPGFRVYYNSPYLVLYIYTSGFALRRSSHGQQRYSFMPAGFPNQIERSEPNRNNDATWTRTLYTKTGRQRLSHTKHPNSRMTKPYLWKKKINK